MRKSLPLAFTSSLPGRLGCKPAKPSKVPNCFLMVYFREFHSGNLHLCVSSTYKVPVVVICLPEPKGLSVKTSTNNHRFFMVFPLLTAALSTPPDIWCQIVAHFLIYLIIELAIFVASIVQVREKG
ncbi:hypothetical protein M9H77_13291 [Catharanthus roseus]|uniref:Uncharacterized protein n=1 Tax=Catharanthus roseus TaxID=4058 RepID=A0ACC0BJZ4_CATRO|nr:hypothetical protein M9H77_13291 [Catharanthus roseus]